MPQDLELLAPAGDWTALEAALDAGADAVYLGLRTLNARRRAKNFSPDEFVKAVEAVHARGAKAYLTLRIDLAHAKSDRRPASSNWPGSLTPTPSWLRSGPHGPARNTRKSNFTCPRKPA